MEYQIVSLTLNACKLNTEKTKFNIDVVIEVGIVGDTKGHNKLLNTTVQEVPLSLGEGIPSFIETKCSEYFNTIYA